MQDMKQLIENLRDFSGIDSQEENVALKKTPEGVGYNMAILQRQIPIIAKLASRADRDLGNLSKGEKSKMLKAAVSLRTAAKLIEKAIMSSIK